MGRRYGYDVDGRPLDVNDSKRAPSAEDVVLPLASAASAVYAIGVWFGRDAGTLTLLLCFVLFVLWAIVHTHNADRLYHREVRELAETDEHIDSMRRRGAA